jgi:hypothetical protein
MVILLALGLMAAYFTINALNRASHNERKRVNSSALAEARDALLGFAATYRDNGHANEVYGYLPCPDLDNNGAGGLGGVASVSPVCPATDRSTAGRLPWNSLAIQPLRDHAGECLWYAVSGTAKDVNKTGVFNWDTLGQFIVQDAGGNPLMGGATGAAAHQRPLAVLLAPGFTLAGQTRAASASECSGTTTLASYLESLGAPWPAPAAATTTVTLGTPASIASNNDQAIWITPQDVFDRIRMNRNFKADIDTMMNDITACIGTLGTISPASPTNKGIDTAITDYNANCPHTPLQTNVIVNWRDNLLYAHPAGTSTVTSAGITTENCTAVLLFSGARTATQTRETPLNQGNPAMYLEGSNAALFPNAGAYSGANAFNGLTTASASTDLVRCIKSATVTESSFSKPGDFASYTPAGVGVTTDTSVPANPKVLFNNAAGLNGGCFWNPTALPRTGKTIRAYYEFIFGWADPVGGADRGNGLTLQMVRGDSGAPANCGTQANMGVLPAGDLRGVNSLIFETDVHQDAGHNDLAGNHTAILYGGNLVHSLTNGNLTTACNGSASGCRHTPADKFEESPTPLPHKQRIEIHSGCDASCTLCNATTPAGPNTRVTAWVDCVNCSDIRFDVDRQATPPTLSRCIVLPASMNTIYFGLTAGFRSGASQQGVTVTNLNIRSE